MKKLLFILCLFTCTAGFGQTKEETISWLNEHSGKVLDYVQCHNVHDPDKSKNSFQEYDAYRITANAEEITLRYGYHLPNHATEPSQYYYEKEQTLLLSSILIPVNAEKSITTDKTYFSLRIARHDDENIKQISYTDGEERLSSNLVYFTVRSCSKEALLRVAKAIFHLAELSGAKKEIKVDENKF